MKDIGQVPWRRVLLGMSRRVVKFSRSARLTDVACMVAWEISVLSQDLESFRILIDDFDSELLIVIFNSRRKLCPNVNNCRQHKLIGRKCNLFSGHQGRRWTLLSTSRQFAIQAKCATSGPVSMLPWPI